MEATDLSLIEEWHTGPDDLAILDRLHFRGLSLDELLAKSSRYRREWLMNVTTARAAQWPDNNAVSDDDIEPKPYIP